MRGRPLDALGCCFPAVGHRINDVADVGAEPSQPAEFDKTLVFPSVNVVTRVSATTLGDDFADQLESFASAIVILPQRKADCQMPQHCFARLLASVNVLTGEPMTLMAHLF